MKEINKNELLIFKSENDIYTYRGDIPRFGPYKFTMNLTYQFLTTYFPFESAHLKLTDMDSIIWKGFESGSNPDAYRTAWMKAYNKVGSIQFSEYIDRYMHFLIKHLRNNFEGEDAIIDMNRTNSVVLDNLILSIYISKGTLHDVNISLTDIIEDTDWSYDGLSVSEFIDIVFESGLITQSTKDWAVSIINKYPELDEIIVGKKKETQISMNYSHPHVDTYLANYDTFDPCQEEPWREEPYHPIIKKMEGTIKIIKRNEYVVTIYSENFMPVRLASYGDTFKVIGEVEPCERDSSGYYQLETGEFILKDDYSVILLEKEDEVKPIYSIRVKSDTIPIRANPNDDCRETGTLKKNQVFSIIEEIDGYGKLKSGSGWVKIDENVKKIQR